MIVLIAGMSRSGSTFSFNVARELLLKRGTVVCRIGEDGPETDPEDHAIFKTHMVSQASIDRAKEGRAKAICTYRKPEDAVASLIEAFDYSLDQSIGIIKAWLDGPFVELRPYALTLPYEEIEIAPESVVAKISSFLFGSANQAEVSDIARRYSKRATKEQTDVLKRDDDGVIDVGFSYLHRDTLLHRRHISSVWPRSAEDRIGADAVRRVRDKIPHKF